jgi:hypothetical protein
VHGKCGAGFSGSRISVQTTTLHFESTHGSLLHNDVFDFEILDINVLRVRVGFGVLQQTSDELD